MAATNVQAFSGDVEISSNLAVDTNTLFVDSEGNKVGIGVTDPSTYLHLSAKNSNPGATEGDFIGTHDLTEYLRFTSMADVGDVNTVSVGFKLGADDNSDVGPDGRLDICANDGSSAGNDFGATPDRTIATFLGGGNVGIGTNVPGAKFTLYGDDTQDEGGLLMKVVDRLSFDNGFTGIGLGGYATTSAPIIHVAKSAIIHERTGFNGTGNLMFCNDDTSDNNDVSNTHARMTITGAGDVGIGTTNPVGVNGGQRLEGSSSTGFEYIATRDDTAGEIDDFVGAYLFKNTDTDGTEPHYAGMSAKLTGTNGPMDLRFHTNRDRYETDAVPDMIIDQLGRVGIGEAGPEAKLQVASTAQDSSDASNNANQIRIDCTNTNSHAGTGGGITFCQRYFNGSDSMIATGGVFGARLGGTNGSYGGGLVFKYKPNGSGPIVEGMVLSSSGYVGIGMTEPGYTLDVNGTTRLPTIFRSPHRKELANEFYFASGSTGTANKVLLQIDTNSSAYTDQSEYAGTIDLHIVAQRTQSSYNVDSVNIKLNFCVGWNEQSDAWQILEFIQENKSVFINGYKILTSIPIFKYKYVDRQLQIYVSYNYEQIGAWHTYVATVSGDTVSDITIVGENTLMASGTNGTAFQGICYSTGGNVGIGTASPGHAFEVGGSTSVLTRINNKSQQPHIMLQSLTAHWQLWNNGSDNYLRFYCGGDRAYLQCAGTNDLLNFTGQHRTFINNIPFSQANDLQGFIVSADQNKYIKMSGGIEAGSNAITINESLPIVSLSNVVQDKRCFGVISLSEDPDTRSDCHGNMVSLFEKENGDTRVYINSVGEGALWVTNINGPLESGDYITTSNIAGYGQKQNSDSLKNYTVAKITMDCDFNPVTQPIKKLKQELGDVEYWVNTEELDVSEEEYLNLEPENRKILTNTRYSNGEYDIDVNQYETLDSNTQSTFTEVTENTYIHIKKEYGKQYKIGLEREVRQELVNVLDEHSQIQWEDDPSGATEKAYKIRYLDADGNITDEANHVYKAAFVGCTYHCG
jgi:hypothetical protein